MDAILINEELELKVYVLHVSEDVQQAELLVTEPYGNGETAVCIASINFKFNSIFEFNTLAAYHIHCHKDYVAVIEKVSSMLYERYGD